jgi:hypothetical protein
MASVNSLKNASWPGWGAQAYTLASAPSWRTLPSARSGSTVSSTSRGSAAPY